MTAPGNLFDNIYKSPTQRSTTGNLFDNIYISEEERKRREAEEARRQELFRGAGASGTFEEPTLSDRAKRIGEQAKRLGSILETRTTAGATDLAANLAGLARRVRVPGAATAETMLRGTALQQRQQIQPETATEALAALAGESVAPVASAYATGGFLTSIGRGAGPLASAARAIAGPEKLTGSMLQRTGQVLRRGVGGTAVAAPLVTVPGAIAGGQQSTTASLSQMLDALAQRPRTELAPDAGILERTGRAVGEAVEEPAREALGALSKTAGGRVVGDLLTDFFFGTVPEIGFRGGRMAVREGTAATRRGATKVSDLIADRLKLRQPPTEDAAEAAARKLAEQEAEAAAAKAAEEQARREAQRAAEERLMAEPPSAISQAMRGFQREMQGYGPRALEIPAREVPQAPSVRQAIEEMRAPFVGQARAEREIAENAARLEAEREAYRQTVRETREGQLAGLGRQAMAAEQAAADQLVAPTTIQQRALEALRSPRGRAALAGVAQAGIGAGVGMGLGETPEEKAFLAMTLAGVPAAGRDLPPSALPTIPQEVRSVGRFGFVRTPETYVLDEVLEREHVNNVLRLTEPRLAGRGAKPTEVAGGTGLFGGEASPNALYRFDEAVDDDAIRQTAAIRGLAYGQDQQLWYRRSVDTDLPENKTKSIVVTGPAGAPLSEQAIADVISRVRQDDVLGTYGGATRDGDHLMFLNLKRYTGMDDDEFQRRVMQGLADVGQQHDIKPFNSTFYAEHLDGTPAYLRTLGRYPDALRAARDAIVDAAPEYRRYAERIGADVAEVDARVAERLDGLDRLLRQVESPPPLGRTQGAIPLKDAAQTVYTRFPRILGTKPERVVPEMVSRLDTMVNDLVDQGVIPREMAQDWYRGATLDQRAIARLALPELREDPKYTLYTVVNSILSSGQEVPVETRQGLNVFNQYLRTGRFSVLDPESVQYKQALTGGKKGLTGERGEGVLGERMAASPRTLNHEQALARLDAMVQSLGEEGTIEALVGGVPILGPGRVVKEERPALVYLFGPKIGQYAMDKLGMPGGGKSTIDLWMARLDYALRGDKAGAAGGKMQDAVSPEMRRRMQQVLAEFATRNNMPESSAQALAWYAIKNAFRNAGAKEKRLAYTTLGSGTTEALMSPAKDFSTPIAQGLMRGQSYARAAEGWDDKTLREFARRTGREGAIQPIAGAFAGKVFDIGGATGEVFRRLASTEAGRRALVKTGVIGAGELVETAGEGEDGSPFLRATGKGMKALGAASLVYPTMKRGAVAGGTRVRDALAQSPQGRFILNSISRDILADPRVKELVEAAVDEQARYNAISRQLSAEAQRLGPEGNRLVSDVVEQEAFENAQMSPDDMAAVIALANRIADAVEGMGAEKVGQRLISPATYEKGRRTYLRRDYARYAGEAAMEETPAGARKAPFRLETMKQRLDLTPEQRNELGEIREASYKVAQTIGRGGKDIATARLFNALADLPGMVEPRYKAALDEMLIAKGLRDAARETGDDVAAKDAARAYLEAKGRLKQVSDEFKKNPSEYVTMPDTPNLGVLRGAVVRRDVADYVNGVDDFGDTTSIFKQLNQIWKKVKTVYNASTHFGNFMSNIGVAHVKGLPIQLQPYYLKLAADALDPNIKFAVGRTIAGGAVGGMLGDTPAERAQYALAGAAAAGAGPEVLRRTGVLKSQKRPIKYDPDVQFLTESGILGSSLPFYGNLPMQGLTEDRTALRALAGTTRPETRTVLAEQGIKPMGRAEQVAREADTRITRAYALEDGIFRVALFKRFKDQGLDNAQALAKLKESFPSYDTRSPILKVTRNFYSPFVMFSAKYIPMMLDGIMQHPERWVTLAAIWGGVNELSRRQYGEVRPEDLPANQRDYNYLIPGRIQVDAITRPAFKALGIDVPEGDKYTFDVARWTPFSAITGSPAPGMIASQLDIGGLPIPAIAQPGGPIVDVAALAFGVDPFTGEKILQPGMSGTEQLEAIAGQAASIATPSMLSFQIPRILKDLERGDDAAAAVDALSLVGLRPQVVRRGLQGIREKKKYEDAVRGIRMRYKVEMRKNRDPERRKELQEEAMRGLLREAQKYKAIMQPEMP